MSLGLCVWECFKNMLLYFFFTLFMKKTHILYIHFTLSLSLALSIYIRSVVYHTIYMVYIIHIQLNILSSMLLFVFFFLSLLCILFFLFVLCQYVILTFSVFIVFLCIKNCFKVNAQYQFHSTYIKIIAVYFFSTIVDIF